MAACRVHRLRVLEAIEQLRDRHAGQLRHREQGAILAHFTDAAAGVIATWVAEVDLVVLDDLLVKIRDVDRSVGAHLDVDRSKLGMFRNHQRRQRPGHEAMPIVGQGVAINAMR